MGHRPPSDRGIRRRRRRARRHHPHHVRGRRREAVDLLVPGRGAARYSTSCAGGISRGRSRAAGSAGGSCGSITRSARGRMSSARSMRCSPPRRSPQHHDRSKTGMPGHLALPDAAPGLIEIWPLVEAEPRAEIEAWDAPFDAAAGDRARRSKLAAKIADTVRDRIARRRAGRPRAGRSRLATCWCWCAGAGRCSTRSSAP